MRGEDGTPQSRLGFLATVCTHCGNIGGPQHTGKDCQYCGEGVYLRHGLFTLNLCPICLGKSFGCKACLGRGLLPTPREDITHEQAAAVWAELEAQKNEPPRPYFQPEPDAYVWKRKKRRRRSR